MPHFIDVPNLRESIMQRAKETQERTETMDKPIIIIPFIFSYVTTGKKGNRIIGAFRVDHETEEQAVKSALEIVKRNDKPIDKVKYTIKRMEDC